jgi:hypothetical protein
VTQSITPEIVVTDNSTAFQVVYTPSVTKSVTPPSVSVKASTNITVVYQP